MTGFSKLSLKTLVSNNNQIVSVRDKNDSGLKTWQLGLLLGIPTALLAFYLIYNRNNKKQNNTKSTNKQQTETSQKQNKTNENLVDTTTEKKEPPNETTLDDKINTIIKQNSESSLDKAVKIKSLGNEFFQTGKFEEAAKCYSAAIDQCPENDRDELPKFYQNRAAAYENLKLYDKVVEDCTAALQVDPNYSKALARRAKAYESLNLLEQAFEDHTALCIIQKFSGPSMTAADRLVKKIGEIMGREIFNKRESIPISQHFVNNFYIGLNNDIIFKNEDFFNRVKESGLSQSMLNALIDFNEGNYESCIQNCSQVIEANSDYVLEAHNLRGSLYMLRCQYKDAKKDFDVILNDTNASGRLKSNTYIKLTALNLQNSEERQAFENYDKAIEVDPTNEDIYCNRAQVYAMKGRFDECFKDFDKCIELNEQHKIAKLQKAFFEFRQFYAQLAMLKNGETSLVHESDELKQETVKLENLLDEYSDVPEAYNLYAQILSEQENYEKAEKYYKIALENDPKNAALLVQRALNIMTWKNDFNEPIEMLNEAIQIDTTCEFAYETLATIEIQRGNLNRAVELFEEAINLTRSEDSLTNLCCMLVGAKTQFKILQQYRGSVNLV